MILEYRDTIGGRAWNKPFGKNKDGKPYIIEMGANWVCIFQLYPWMKGLCWQVKQVQGIGSEGGPQNPIWGLVSLEISSIEQKLTLDRRKNTDWPPIGQITRMYQPTTRMVTLTIAIYLTPITTLMILPIRGQVRFLLRISRIKTPSQAWPWLVGAPRHMTWKHRLLTGGRGVSYLSCKCT